MWKIVLSGVVGILAILYGGYTVYWNYARFRAWKKCRKRQFGMFGSCQENCKWSAYCDHYKQSVADSFTIK